MLPILSSPPAPVQRKKRTACRSYYHPGAQPVKPPRFHKRGEGSLLGQRSYQPASVVPPSVACWGSRWQWLTTLATLLSHPACDKIRREISIKVETVMEVAKCEADAADHNGRNVFTSNASVARRLGCSTKTVRRARLLLKRLGLAVESLRGRYLNEEERIAAELTHGGEQRRCASTRHLTIPKSVAVFVTQMKCPPTPRRGVRSITHLTEMVTKRSAGTKSSKKNDGTDRSLPMQRLAARMAHSMPWLLRDKTSGKTLHIGHLLRILTQAGINPERTSATDIHRAIELTNGGRETLDGRTAHAPLGYFAHLLRQARPVIDELATNKKYAENQQARRKGTCGHPDCDGHGFHNHKHADGTTTVSRCPHHAPIRLTPLEK